MGFIVRGAREDDLKQLVELAKQFALLNLPPDRKTLEQKVALSLESFAGKVSPEKAEFLFVLEEKETGFIAGSSQIIAKHGTATSPHLFFKIIQKNRMSEDLGIGFIHKVLRFCEETDGPTEIGGLLVDRNYRRRPEKVGKTISLMRFVYMAMRSERFMRRVHCELAPPLTEEGRSEFWEALGRRFTGMPYQEADQLSHINKEFITQLFPEEDIYLALLDSRARLAIGQVGQSTLPAKHLLKSIGFKYLNEVDPFDGGPHYGASMKDISVVNRTVKAKVGQKTAGAFQQQALLGFERGGEFWGTASTFILQGEEVILPEATRRLCELNEGEVIYLSAIQD